jgi:hypothetical protein
MSTSPRNTMRRLVNVNDLVTLLRDKDLSKKDIEEKILAWKGPLLNDQDIIVTTSRLLDKIAHEGTDADRLTNRLYVMFDNQCRRIFNREVL